MKKFLTLALSALLTMGLLTACGGKTTDKTVDLTAFYNTLAEEYGWAEDAASSGEEDIMMMNLEGDMLEGSYPGLADVATKQLIAKAPMISAVVNEIVLAECGTEEDAATAASILQDRVDAQAEGGAWYPESMETWSNAQVVQNGTYVAMIATADHQEEIAEQFNVDADSITMDTSFEDDLNADSVDIVDLSMAMEEEFGIDELGEEEAASITTVGDLVRFLQNKVD